MSSFVFDANVIVKGLVEPRRKKEDELFEREMRLHKKAKEYLLGVEAGQIEMMIPSIALIEVACVVSRLTGDDELARDAVNFLLWGARKIFFDSETLDAAINTGIKTKASGFDTVYLVVLEMADAVLITDDLKLHNLAKRMELKSELLREIA